MFIFKTIIFNFTIFLTHNQSSKYRLINLVCVRPVVGFLMILMDGRYIPSIQKVFNYCFVMQSSDNAVTFDTNYLKDQKTRERAPVMLLSIDLCLT